MESSRWLWIVLILLGIVLWRRGSGYGGPQVTVQELKALLERPSAEAAAAVLIDVREPEEFAAGHVPGARNIPLSEVARRSAELPAGATVFVICQVGGRSAVACQMLAGRLPGARVVNVEGGTSAWQAAGFPLER
ncbi:MAG: Rhodanese-related sulfurtransferase [Candidatus Ozemobacter sibiricus]|jgi:rhodanese-related sulfurtransferase|uniref:Rhodanese-related sulfurtransferase n=1 Tax=Candidatus Ozemobacter sibiricus TaxID=2268124 RepID=A0A367ZDZ5_9BACT|nr:MAG: Rhodanese-related sulfurtransferase [Candidatus Ozemobacter sibiricus]